MSNRYKGARRRPLIGKFRMTKKAAFSAGIGFITAIILAGGSSTALLSDSFTIEGDEVNSGNLNISPIGSMGWVLKDAAGGPDVPIDLNSYSASPGDSIEGVQWLDIALSGNNLQAVIGASTGLSSTNLYNTSNGVNAYIDVYRSNGVQIASNVPIGDTYLTAIDPAANPDVIDGTADNYIIVKVDFSATADQSIIDGVLLDLHSMNIKLSQYRNGSESGWSDLVATN